MDRIKTSLGKIRRNHKTHQALPRWFHAKEADDE